MRTARCRCHRARGPSCGWPVGWRSGRHGADRGAERLHHACRRRLGASAHVDGLGGQPHGVDADQRSHSRSQAAHADADSTGRCITAAALPRFSSMRMSRGRWALRCWRPSHRMLWPHDQSFYRSPLETVPSAQRHQGLRSHVQTPFLEKQALEASPSIAIRKRLTQPVGSHVKFPSAALPGQDCMIPTA